MVGTAQGPRSMAGDEDDGVSSVVSCMVEEEAGAHCPGYCSTLLGSY